MSGESGEAVKAHTFAVEKDPDGKIWLCVDDGKGKVLVIVEFEDSESVRIFNETLALAKAAAHEHGRNGI